MIVIKRGKELLKSFAWDGADVTVAALLDMAGVPVDQPCGGHGRCGKCRVKAFGDISEPSAQERSKLTDAELAEGIRLACCTRIQGERAEIVIGTAQQMVVETDTTLRKMEWAPWAKGLGVAVDIGTTTVAAYLWDLDTHSQLAVSACKNPQECYGADVISRLEASLNGKAAELSNCIRQCLAQLSEDLCRKAGRAMRDIEGAVITGNTAMLYLLFGYDVHDLAFAPFAAAHRFGEFCNASELGLPWHENCRVYLPPCISAYVGADISCGLLACDARSDDTPAMLADVGTNGELVLRCGEKFCCCATAAGPAFEGVGISCGSSAIPGAIDRVEMTDGILEVHTIAGEPAKTVCGSGLMDAIYCLLKEEQIEETGFIEDELPLAENVVLTQKDIRAFQLAKSAVCAGMETLFDYAGISVGEIKTVWLAGGFGNKLSPASAAGVGLIPAALAPVIVPTGNSAAAGASLLLRSKEAIEEICLITAACETVDLATSPVFQARFMDDMMLGEVR